MTLNKGSLTLRFSACFLIFAFSAYAYDSGIQEIESAQGVAWLQTCQEKVLGIELLCNKNWKQDVRRNTITFTISEDPAVLLTVVRSDEVYTGIDELTYDQLKQKGQYDDGFHMEKLEVGGYPAVKVEGYTHGFEDIKLMDLYVYHDLKIYGFLFSVNPKGQWERFTVLFEQMIKSIEFIDKQN